MRKLFILIFLIISQLATATDYYIRTGGNDGLAGTSDANAWATIKKVNDFSINTGFQPGDNIYFRRGDIFNILSYTGGSSPYDDAVNNCQGLRIQQSGISGNPVTIGAYGTGNRPVLNGRTSVRAWNLTGSWSNMGGNIWRMTGSIWWGESYMGRGRLWINGSEVMMSENVGTPTSTRPYSHSIGTENYLYLYSTSNPATAFSNIEDQGWSNYGITVYQVDYQTIQNLEVRGCVHAIVNSGSDNMILEDCTIGLYSAMQGVFIDGDDFTGSTDSNNGIIRRCTLETGDKERDDWFRPNTEDGILLRSNCNNWQISFNTLSNWSHACIGIYAISGYPVTNVLIHDNMVTSPNVDYSIGFAVAAGVGDFTNIQIYNNRFYDIPNENQVDSKGVKIFNNVIDKVTGVSWHQEEMMRGSGMVFLLKPQVF